jgi:hypothetical protein
MPSTSASNTTTTTTSSSSSSGLPSSPSRAGTGGMMPTSPSKSLNRSGAGLREVRERIRKELEE